MPGDSLAAWERVIRALEERRELTLMSLYQQARILRWDESGVHLGFPSGTATAELATDADSVASMRTFLAEHLGAPVELHVSTLEESELASREGAKSIVQAHEERQRDERDRRENEARQHPATRAVLDTFGASIKEIKTDV